MGAQSGAQGKLLRSFFLKPYFPNVYFKWPVLVPTEEISFMLVFRSFHYCKEINEQEKF